MSRLSRTIVSSLALMFGMAAAGCGESDADLARKPQLVDSLIENAIATTDTGRVASEDGADFRTRLRAVLMDAETKNLALLKDLNVVVTLDQRLMNQDEGFFGRRIDGVFYNEGPAPIVALWDNGKSPAAGSFFKMTTYDYGSTMVDKIAERIRDGDTRGVPLALAARYTRHKSSSITKWLPADDFNSRAVKKNDAILRRAPRRGKQEAPSPGDNGAGW